MAEGIRDGKSYSEIGTSLGISKQAAHKLAGAAITTLRENLASMGFQGIDTLGLLKSGCGVSPQSVLGGVSPPVSPNQVDDFSPHPYFKERVHPIYISLLSSIPQYSQPC